MELHPLDQSFYEVTSQNGETYVCDTCGVIYQTKSGLEKHRFRKHGVPPQKYRKYTCQFWNFDFTTKGHLEGHINMHHNLRPHMYARRAILVISFVTDLTQKYVGWKKPIEGETLASSPLWAFSTRHISVQGQ